MVIVSGISLRLRVRQMAGYLCGRDGLVIEPALDRVAARRPGERGLRLGLYTLSGYEHVHGAGDGDAGNHHRPAARVVRRLDDQRAVDLELLEAELPEKPDRGITGAEIVERDTDAEAADQIERAAGHGRVADKVRLGDLQFEPLGRKAGLLEDVAELDGEIGIAQLRGRNVDRELDAVPAEGIGAGLTQHPAADRVDQAGLLGDRNEHRRIGRAAVRPLPTQQGLDGYDGAARGVDQRLVVESEFLVRDRLA